MTEFYEYLVSLLLRILTVSFLAHPHGVNAMMRPIPRRPRLCDLIVFLSMPPPVLLSCTCAGRSRIGRRNDCSCGPLANVAMDLDASHSAAIDYMPPPIIAIPMPSIMPLPVPLPVIISRRPPCIAPGCLALPNLRH